MNNMFELKRNALGFEVNFDGTRTVGDFINSLSYLASEPNNWGYIFYYSEFDAGFGIVKYVRNKIVAGTFSNDVTSKEIKKIVAKGGWGRLDYEITVVDKEVID